MIQHITDKERELTAERNALARTKLSDQAAYIAMRSGRDSLKAELQAMTDLFMPYGTGAGAMDKMLAEAEAIKADAETKWIPVGNRLPFEDDGTVAVLMDDGSILTAWATYWHGASNKFAQWTHPFDVDDAQVTHWTPLPKATS